MSKENEILKEPEILKHLADVRTKFAAEEEGAERFELWEKQAKNALIMLSLNGHEGIEMIKNKAKEEIKERYLYLKTTRPTDLSQAGMTKYVTDHVFTFQTIDLWTWFLNLFSDAKEVLEEIEHELEVEDERTDVEEEED